MICIYIIGYLDVKAAETGNLLFAFANLSR